MSRKSSHLACAFDRFLLGAADAVRTEFAGSVRQVYVVSDDREPDPIATCVFIRVGHRYFAVTAAHVLDHGHTARLYVGAERGIVSLPESGLYTPTPKRGRDADLLDIGVLEFDAVDAAGLGNVRWIGPSDFDPIDTFHSTMACTVLGYPRRRSRVLASTQRVESRLYSITSFIDPSLYERLSLDPRLHVPLAFSRKRMRLNGQRATAPLLHGASGGGIWRCANITGPLDARRVYFAGIVTEWRQGTANALVGTRASFIRVVLGVRWPDLASHFTPQPISIDSSA